jgi:hypothetical protein
MIDRGEMDTDVSLSTLGIDIHRGFYERLPDGLR